MSFKVASKVLLDNISDDDSDNDDSGKNLGGKTLVSIEQQQNQHQQKKLTDEQLSELYKREIKLCTDKVKDKKQKIIQANPSHEIFTIP